MDQHQQLVQEKTAAILSTSARTLSLATEAKFAKFDAELGRLAGEMMEKVSDGAMTKIGTSLESWSARTAEQLDAKDDKSNWDKILLALTGLSGAVGGGMAISRSKTAGLKAGAALALEDPRAPNGAVKNL